MEAYNVYTTQFLTQNMSNLTYIGIRHGNLSTVLRARVALTSVCVCSECTSYSPMVIHPLLHRAGPCTDCRTIDVLRLILTRPTRVWKLKQVSGKVWRFTLFQFDKLPGKHCFSSLCLALHDKPCFSSQRRAGHRDGLRQRNSFTSVHLTGLS